jgi:DNA polymerase-3 subunit epsilon
MVQYAGQQSTLIAEGDVEAACILTQKYVKMLTAIKSQGSIAMEKATRFLLERDWLTRTEYDDLNLALWKQPHRSEYQEALRMFQRGENVPSAVQTFFSGTDLKGRQVENGKLSGASGTVAGGQAGGEGSGAAIDGVGRAAVSAGDRPDCAQSATAEVSTSPRPVEADKKAVCQSKAKATRSAQEFVVRAPATFLAPDAFLGNGAGHHLVFLDFETNGLKDCSVLSATALCVYFYNGAFIVGKLFNRYYYPREAYNEKAIAVNKLSETRIKALREDAPYVRYFEKDRDWGQVCQWGDIFIAHNIAFDRKFMCHEPEQTFCTMLTNAPVLRISKHPRTGAWKWPKLQATAEHYKIKIKKELLHFGFYDTWLCFSIFQKMFQQRDTAVYNILGVRDET